MNSVIILGDDEHALYGTAYLACKCPWLSITLISEEKPYHGSSAVSTRGSSSGVFDIIGMPWQELLFSGSATFKMANHFFTACNGKESFFQGGAVGEDIGLLEFHQIINSVNSVEHVEKYDDYSLAVQVAKRGKCLISSGVAPGVHYDLAALRQLLKDYVKSLGVNCVVGNVAVIEVGLDQRVKQVSTQEGVKYTSDFYVDARCSASTIVQENKYLGANVSTDTFFDVGWCLVGLLEEHSVYLPVTEYRHLANGYWLKKTPLQSRTVVELYGGGSVPQPESHAEIFERFGIAVKAGSTRLTRTKIGRKDFFWIGNLLLIGRAACATGNVVFPALDLTRYQIEQFLRLFPSAPQCDKVIAEYNRITTQAADNVLDYHHFIRTVLMASDWPSVESENFSPELKRRVSLFQSIGRYEVCENELISKDEWITFFMGLKLAAGTHDPLIGAKEEAIFPEFLKGLKAGIVQAVNELPNHLVFLSQILQSRNKR